MIEYRSIKEFELKAWSNHCKSVFSEVFGYDFGDYFLKKWFNDPWRDLDSILVAVHDNKIISTVRIFYRKMYLYGDEISVGGIGEVSTQPEYRQKGIASELLKKAIEKMKQREIKISILDTGNPKFYSGFGWQEVQWSYKISELKLNNKYLDITNIRPLRLPDDLDYIKSIYSGYSRSYNGPIVRNNDFYWTNWLESVSNKYWVLEDKLKRPSAYMFIDKENDNYIVKEFCTKNRESDDFGILAKGILMNSGKKEYKLKYPFAINSNIPVVSNYTCDGGLMYSLITPFKIGNILVESTEQLVKLIKNEDNTDSQLKYLFWEPDSF